MEEQKEEIFLKDMFEKQQKLEMTQTKNIIVDQVNISSENEPKVNTIESKNEVHEMENTNIKSNEESIMEVTNIETNDNDNKFIVQV